MQDSRRQRSRRGERLLAIRFYSHFEKSGFEGAASSPLSSISRRPRLHIHVHRVLRETLYATSIPRQDFCAAFPKPRGKTGTERVSSPSTYPPIYTYTYMYIYIYVHTHPRGAICMLVLVLKPTGDFRSHSFYTKTRPESRPLTPLQLFLARDYTRTHASPIAVPSIGNGFSRN